MRRVLVLALLAACEFEHGALPTSDGPRPDMMPDVVVPTWTVDGMSQKGLPANTMEWDQMRQAYGLVATVPDHLWLVQETSGVLADSVGTVPLAPSNAPSYRNPVSGWSRAAVGTNDADGDRGFSTAAIGNMDGTSYLALIYVAVVSTPSLPRSLIGIGASTDHRYVAIMPTGLFRATGVGVTPGDGTVPAGVTVHPIVVKLDATKLIYTVYSDRERVSAAWAGTSSRGGLFVIGNAIIGSADARYLYSALWTGPKAELADADVKKLLQSLGWAVTGY